MTVLSERCKSRIFNCKFAQAVQYLRDPGTTAEERRVVRDLAERYGNIGMGYDEEMGEEEAGRLVDACKGLGVGLL